MKSKKASTRRNFIEYLLYGGGGILAGKHIAKPRGDSKLSKFITADGKVVMIDPKHLQKLEGGRISNEDLQAWMKTGKRD